MKQFPFANEKDLIDAATDIWYNQCESIDWLESFTHHPKIGDVKSLTKKFAGKEQASVAAATKKTIAALGQCQQRIRSKIWLYFYCLCHRKISNRNVAAVGRQAQQFYRRRTAYCHGRTNENYHTAVSKTNYRAATGVF